MSVVFTTRRYAMTLCPSVTSRSSVETEQIELVLAWELPPILHSLPSVGRKVWYLQTLDLENFATARYDTRCYFNVRSKADISQLNLPHRRSMVVSTIKLVDQSCSGFVVQLVPAVLQQLARFRLTHRLARSACDSRAFFIFY